MKKAIIAMSGGVDSSVAAYLLKKRGYEVLGVTLRLWQGGAVDDARQICEMLEIPHYVADIREIFQKKVIDGFAAEYLAGRTPNPCIVCNRFVKWENLLAIAREHKADFIATGHYAQIVSHPDTRRLSIVASNSPKDQSYALYTLSQEALAQTIFPIGDMPKEQVREIARKNLGLAMADKPDSQEICFVPDKNHAKFLANYLGRPLPKGNFVDSAGKILGEHKGLGNYTIGQRKGLGAFGAPVYVAEIDGATANITLTPDESELFGSQMIVESLNFMAYEDVDGEVEMLGKIRYAHKPAPCTIRRAGSKIICNFKQPQRAITPGQSAVFYDNQGHVICGGIICKS
ncbi:MAG: tRNA 2-thiouridine(34) synthase MnmA [Clostridiales bacterium]|jgi:tRNA-specific 2-thiouridylase|nr:tRNA 2-thiouridine(34) synthase MnmA [Clostridiales bacterium]